MNAIRRIAIRYKRIGLDMASAMAHSHHTRIDGECPHCETRTVWAARALSGFYRCMRCGGNPLDASPRAGAK